jgi:hypothetical protein
MPAPRQVSNPAGVFLLQRNVNPRVSFTAITTIEDTHAMSTFSENQDQKAAADKADTSKNAVEKNNGGATRAPNSKPDGAKPAPARS